MKQKRQPHENKKIAQEILKMAKLDQKARKSFTMGVSSWKRIQEIDRVNFARLKKIVKRFGWPTVDLVGKKASHFAWLLVQHADKDVEFQQYCLKLMKKEVESDEVAKADIAFFTDRILVNRGKPQIYGTQFYESQGKLIPRPIKNFDKLNERRKKIGLEPFEVYKKKLLKQSSTLR